MSDDEIVPPTLEEVNDEVLITQTLLMSLLAVMKNSRNAAVVNDVFGMAEDVLTSQAMRTDYKIVSDQGRRALALLELLRDSI